MLIIMVYKQNMAGNIKYIYWDVWDVNTIKSLIYDAS